MENGRVSIFNKQMLGERIKARREYLGLTQQEVADALSLNRVTYAQYEQGRNEIAATDLPRLGEVLRVSPSYFLGEIEAAEVQEDEFLKFYQGRPQPQKEQARRVLRALFDAQDADPEGK